MIACGVASPLRRAFVAVVLVVRNPAASVAPHGRAVAGELRAIRPFEKDEEKNKGTSGGRRSHSVFARPQRCGPRASDDVGAGKEGPEKEEGSAPHTAVHRRRNGRRAYGCSRLGMEFISTHLPLYHHTGNARASAGLRFHFGAQSLVVVLCDKNGLFLLGREQGR